MGPFEFNPENLFDVSRLNEDELGQLEYIVNSPAWEGFFKRYLLGIVTSLERLMKDRSSARKAQYNDDFLAGQCTAIEGFIAFCDGIVQSTNMARMAEAQRMTPDQEYDKLRAMGFIKHAGQTTRAEDLVPFEEF